ncbi:tyrosine-type recombinase/integrase [Deinococcus detaillensis]|uniref:Tyrosine-type recombinase/integrase n=1 Tax=Deinococcus detaillensis TaxID=2592048 RepID=A0A553UKQ6_9DEIO|nr:tyrosine-type recombinase/integrase [Deinococcus detaillensis]TSA80786.1 tyrosine-type recombinase/integrase [Deinococcus detaillensis]
MKENTALAASMPYPHNWDTLARDKREKIVRKALKSEDVETLLSLTDHNLLMFGKGGAHTSPHTRRAYATGVRVYLAYALPLGWKRLTEYDTDLTIGYLRQLERAGVKPGTINSRRSAARALYRALRWAGVLQADPFGDTPRAQDNEDRWAKREAYSKEDIERLLGVAGPGERLLILLGAHGALRMSEMVALDWSHIDLEARTMRIFGKGRKLALVHLSGLLHEALSGVAVELRRGLVLPWCNPKSVRLALKHLCLMAEVKYEKRQVHGLRHSAATMLLSETHDIFVVARHMRHSSIATTEIYAKADPTRLVGALARFGEGPEAA